MNESGELMIRKLTKETVFPFQGSAAMCSCE